MFGIEEQYLSDANETIEKWPGNEFTFQNDSRRLLGFAVQFKISDLLIGYYILPNGPDDGKDILFEGTRIDVKTSISKYPPSPSFRHSFPEHQINYGDGTEAILYVHCFPDPIKWTPQGLILKKDIPIIGKLEKAGSFLDNGVMREKASYTILNKDLSREGLYENILQKLQLSI